MAYVVCSKTGKKNNEDVLLQTPLDLQGRSYEYMRSGRDNHAMREDIHDNMAIKFSTERLLVHCPWVRTRLLLLSWQFLLCFLVSTNIFNDVFGSVLNQ